MPVTLLGGYFFWRNHLHISDIEAARQQEEQEAGEAVDGVATVAAMPALETGTAQTQRELQQGITASDGEELLLRQRKSVQFERLLSGRFSVLSRTLACSEIGASKPLLQKYEALDADN